MARKRNEGLSIDPTNLSIQDIIEMDIGHMKGLSVSSLARLTSRLVSAYNKRAKRLEQSGVSEYSPAYQGIAKAGKTRLSVKGKRWNELISTLADAKRFLSERKTSTVRGAKQVKRELEQRLGHPITSKEQAQAYWEAIDKLKEKGIGVDKRTSTDIQREVADMMLDEGKSVDDVLRHYGVIIEANAGDSMEETESLFSFGDVNDDGFTDEISRSGTDELDIDYDDLF